ncbi:MAG: LapA family protein [Rhodospirillales bacterium]|nr:LapA family protein [Rhodospirillales bacterium]
MRLISWIIVAIVAIAAMSFAISNRDPVTLDLWPLPFKQEAPLYLAILGAALVGFLVAGFLSLFPLTKWKHLARARERDMEISKRKIERFQDQIKDLEAATKPAAPAAQSRALQLTPQDNKSADAA